MASPAPVIPTAPTTTQLNARNTAVGAPVTPTGEYTPSVNGLPPTLGTTFSSPDQSKSMQAPAVVTSGAAENHVNDIATKANTSAQNISDLHAFNATSGGQNPTSDATQKPEKPAPQNTATDSTDAITSLLGELSGNLGVGNVSKTAVEGEQTQITQDQADIEAMHDPNNPVGIPATLTAMYQMANGTYPLTPAQQAQINDIPAQYSSAIALAKNYAENVLGGANARNASTGMQEYSPGIALSNIASAIQVGSQKIAAVNTKMLDAQAKLHESIEAGDYKGAALYMTQLNAYVKDRTDEISTINTAIDREQTKMQNAIRDNMTAIMDSNTISNDAKMRALAQATLDEKTSYDNKRIAIEQKKLDAAASGSSLVGNQNIPSASFRADGSVDPIQQQAVLASLPGGADGEIATDIKALADYTMNPNDFQQKNYKGGLGLTHQQAVALAKKYDPSYDERNYPAASKYLAALRSTATTSTGGQLQSANRAIEHLTTYSTAMKALFDAGINKGGANWLNAAVTANGAFSTKDTQQKLSNAKSAATIISTELPKYFRGGTSAENDIKTMQETLDTHATPGNFYGSMGGFMSLLSEQLTTSYAAYENALGHPPPAPGEKGSLLTRTAYDNLVQMHDTLKNQGVDVSMWDPADFAGVPNPDPVEVGAPPSANPANNPDNLE